jgi:hypothetical protein
LQQEFAKSGREITRYFCAVSGTDRCRLSRMNCQMFSTGLSSGDFGGKGIRVMLSGTSSLAERCQAA